MRQSKENMEILAELVADGQTHQTGDLYAAFLEKSGEEIARKDFLMFLRAQVLSDGGVLKRTGFGVYQKRTDPQDRGVMLTRGEGPAPAADLIPGSPEEAEAIPLEDALEEISHLSARISASMREMDQLDMSRQAQRELHAVRDRMMNDLDSAVTGITAAIAWRDDLKMATPEESPAWGMQMDM